MDDRELHWREEDRKEWLMERLRICDICGGYYSDYRECECRTNGGEKLEGGE